MSSVLHPVGPEPQERYWVRRLAVLVAAIVAIGIVIALVGNAVSAGSAVQAEPAPPTLAPTTVPLTPSASPTPEATATPTPGVTGTPAATVAPTTGSATPGATASASPTTGSVVTPDPKQKPTTERSTPPTDADKRRAAQQAAEKKAAAKKKAASKVLATCPTDDLRPTLTGPRTLKATKGTSFSLSLINGSSTACYLKMTSANFTLTIVSGKDRIWSTEDCPAAVPPQSRKLAPQKAVGWTVRWDGSRSKKGCKQSKVDPGAGYYWAIASYDDAKEVRWRLVLT